MDATRGGALHGWFGAASRWGVAECLTESLPLLGAIQSGGAPGLYLLSRGHRVAGRAEALGPLLDRAQRHFTRVIVGVDRGALGAWREAFAERRADAWWFDPRPRARAGHVTRPPGAGRPFVVLRSSRVAGNPLEVLVSRIEAYRGAARLAAAGRAPRGAQPAGRPAVASPVVRAA